MHTPKQACKHGHDWHYTQWVMFNRKGFGLIINKLITHLVDGAGAGQTGGGPSLMPAVLRLHLASFPREQPLSIFATERAHFPEAYSICRPPMRVPQTHTHTHLHIHTHIHTPAKPQGSKWNVQIYSSNSGISLRLGKHRHFYSTHRGQVSFNTARKKKKKIPLKRFCVKC